MDTLYNMSLNCQRNECLLQVECYIQTNVITEEQKQLISLVNYVVLCGAISLFGTIANIINLIIFYKQGLNTTINISFFALAISDLCSLILQQFFNVYINPLFENSGLPLVYAEVQYLTTAIKREMFAKITCLITVYITAERCLCIAFPLHIKQMITPRRTTAVVIIIYGLVFMSAAPLFCVYYIDWKFLPHRNQTLIALAFRRNKDQVEGVVYLIQALLGLLSFLAVVVLTSILIHRLGQKDSWRQMANMSQEKSQSMSNRDRATMSMVVLIASILIVCYIPSVILFLVTFFQPEFSVGGRFYNLYYSLWSVAMVTENINSSVNIFLYFKMSTKYRQTFRVVFSRCVQSSKICNL